VVRDPKAVKRPYIAPAFEVIDANVAKAELQARAAVEDVEVQKILGVIERQLKGTASIPGSPLQRKSMP
jgi:hypothetical protein